MQQLPTDPVSVETGLMTTVAAVVAKPLFHRHEAGGEERKPPVTKVNAM